VHHSVVTRELAPFEHVNLQTAVDAWSARAAPDAGTSRLVGVRTSANVTTVRLLPRL